MTDTVRDHLINYTLQYKSLEGCYKDMRYSVMSYCTRDIASCWEMEALHFPLQCFNSYFCCKTQFQFIAGNVYPDTCSRRFQSINVTQEFYFSFDENEENFPGYCISVKIIKRSVFKARSQWPSG